MVEIFLIIGKFGWAKCLNNLLLVEENLSDSFDFVIVVGDSCF